MMKNISTRNNTCNRHKN